MPTNEDPLPADVRAYLEQMGEPWNRPGKLLAKYPKPKVWQDGDRVTFSTSKPRTWVRRGGRWTRSGIGLSDAQINEKRNLANEEDDEW